MIKKVLQKAIPIKKIEEKVDSEKLKAFAKAKYGNFKSELNQIVYKCHDLKQTNYDLAMRHIEKGNISEASFRFWIMTKFWPKYYEAYYELAYCHYLDDKNDKAKKVLKDLIAKNTDINEKAVELLEIIEELEMQEELEKSQEKINQEDNGQDENYSEDDLEKDHEDEYEEDYYEEDYSEEDNQENDVRDDYEESYRKETNRENN